MGDTIEVRILVATWPDGKWHAMGWTGQLDAALIDEMRACEWQLDQARLSWVTARVPMPAPLPADTIEGSASDV